jgi:hypothetical protein
MADLYALLAFTFSSWWVHVGVISLICTDGEVTEKEMRYVYQGKKVDIVSEEETYPQQKKIERR